MIKKTIFEGDFATIKSLIEKELEAVMISFPEIGLQLDMITFEERIEKEGVASVLKDIKEKYSHLSSSEIILNENNQITHISLSQLLPKLLLSSKKKSFSDNTLSTMNCKISLWEKINSSILSKRGIIY